MDSTKSIEFQDIKTETETSITSLCLKQEYSLLKNFPGINKLLFLIIPWGLPIIPTFTTFIRQNKYYRAISLSKQSTICKEEAQMSHFTRKWAKPQVLCCFCNQRMYTAKKKWNHKHSCPDFSLQHIFTIWIRVNIHLNAAEISVHLFHPSLIYTYPDNIHVVREILVPSSSQFYIIHFLNHNLKLLRLSPVPSHKISRLWILLVWTWTFSTRLQQKEWTLRTLGPFYRKNLRKHLIQLLHLQIRKVEWIRNVLEDLQYHTTSWDRRTNNNIRWNNISNNKNH